MNPVYSPAVIDMITVSAEYCLFLEKLTTSGTTRREFLEKITRLLPLIYVKASLLPELGEQDAFDLPVNVTEDDYEEVRQSVWRLLKADDEYLEIFTPDMQYSEGAMTHTISEDLADIYQDLKNFVAVFAERNDEAMHDSIVKVQENFRTYWGQCLVNVMRPLHDLLYNKVENEEEDGDIEDNQ
jgi:hypothetical protein